MDENARVRQGVTFALRARREQDCGHAGRLADAIGVHVAGEILHRVVNRQPGRDAAAGRIDVEVNVLFRIGHLEKEQLRDDDVGDHVIHRRAEEKDAVNEQARIDVPAALAAAGLFNHNGNQKILHG